MKLAWGLFSLTLLFSLKNYSQVISNHTLLGRSYAINELKQALSDNSMPNVLNGKSFIIRDSSTAVNIAEPILFGIYGKEHIRAERPYEVYLIDNYWVLSGTLPNRTLGGTFLIIMDARDCKIIRIIHGK